jgi:hypothetical protein
MTSRLVDHADYDFSILFALPRTACEADEFIRDEVWFTEPTVSYELHPRECSLDEFSGYGFVVEPLGGRTRCESAANCVAGLLLCDALANVDGFVDILVELPVEWNFGGLIGIDRDSRRAFSTNCDVAETPEWHQILDTLALRGHVDATFSQSDVGVHVEQRGGNVLIQQMAWEVPAAWGPRGSHHYPLHRFLNGVRCRQKLLQVLDSYERLRGELERRGAPKCVTRRLATR